MNKQATKAAAEEMETARAVVEAVFGRKPTGLQGFSVTYTHPMTDQFEAARQTLVELALEGFKEKVWDKDNLNFQMAGKHIVLSLAPTRKGVYIYASMR